MATSNEASGDADSDYGSDFSAGEEAIVAELLARAQRQESQPPLLALTDNNDEARPRHLHLPVNRDAGHDSSAAIGAGADATGGGEGNDLLAVRIDSYSTPQADQTGARPRMES